jgi:zinc finger protein
VRTNAQNVEIGIYSSEQVPDEEGEKQHHQHQQQQQVPSSEVTCESAGGDGTSRRVSNQGAVQWGQHGSRSGGGMECILGAVAASGGKEVESFMVHCPGCAVEDMEKMYLTDIPHFGEILIMAFNCQACGYRNTEIKPGSSGRRGRRIELHVERDEDWDRSTR